MAGVLGLGSGLGLWGVGVLGPAELPPPPPHEGRGQEVRDGPPPGEAETHWSQTLLLCGPFLPYFAKQTCPWAQATMKAKIIRTFARWSRRQ